MSEWHIGQLAELATGIRGVAYTPDQLCEFTSPETVTLLRSNNIQSGQLDFADVQIVPRVAVSDAQVMQPGDIAVCMSNGSKSLVGKAAPLISGPAEAITVGAFCSIFRPAPGSVRSFVKHAFQSASYRKQLDLALAGSAINNLRNSDLHAFQVPIPPPGEQTQIADVLDTLDTTIRQTEAIIAKLKQVKQGLLHDLLTRGIAANGELRPPQSEAPHLYKASPLGWIPVGWDVLIVNDLLSSDEPAMRSGPFGSALLKHELVEQGLPLLGIDNVHTEKFVNEFSRFVTEKKFNELSRYAVRPDDLMITIMGTVGRCCLVPHDIGPALSSKHTWTISLDQARYSPLLAMLQVNHSPWVLKQFTKDEQGGTMSAIRSETLRNLRLPTPPIGEQREMEARMTTISHRIDAEMQSVAKAKLLKSGLMDDLLTGRVRVTPLLKQEVTT
jgi:type I restriction enzyme S subunit